MRREKYEVIANMFGIDQSTVGLAARRAGLPMRGHGPQNYRKQVERRP